MINRERLHSTGYIGRSSRSACCQFEVQYLCVRLVRILQGFGSAIALKVHDTRGLALFMSVTVQRVHTRAWHGLVTTCGREVLVISPCFVGVI